MVKFFWPCEPLYNKEASAFLNLDVLGIMASYFQASIYKLSMSVITTIFNIGVLLWCVWFVQMV